MDSAQLVSSQVMTGSSHRAIAPVWHTVVVLCILLGFSLLGALAGDRAMRGGAYARIVQYLLVIVVEWLMVAFIWYFVRRRGIRIGDLVGGRWARPVDALRDLGIAVAFLIISGAILQGLGYLLKAAPNAAIRNVLPRGPSEMILWIMVSLTAGFCEELIFRGYLQRQFAALTRSAVGGIVLQGIAFGAGHGYQGWRLMVLISVFGAMFGLLAHWCRSLRPGMIGHFLQDGVGGIVGRHLMR